MPTPATDYLRVWWNQEVADLPETPTELLVSAGLYTAYEQETDINARFAVARFPPSIMFRGIRLTIGNNNHNWLIFGSRHGNGPWIASRILERVQPEPVLEWRANPVEQEPEPEIFDVVFD